MGEYQIKVNAAAEEEIDLIYEWYEKKKTGLGTDFYRDIDTIFSHLSTLPMIAAVRYKNVHCLPMRKYPYMIHYTVLEDEKLVLIEAVRHTSKRSRG